ncbi:hypothetical protein Cgig2_004522 [Carnegiea gigantea]|uniref:START domain-containing protein n=1 Tax=Carnegiea gigantea TaxID=171969 RepID=A0A9Q1K828_9CARY|nr:hypothetical protein Cgig2_004522 [Carnegiea gigantea]
MGMAINEGKMEGWLYIVGYNRFGLHNIRKRFFVLHDNHLKSFKTIPTSQNAVFFTFTLFNTSNHSEKLKECPNTTSNLTDCSGKKWRLGRSRRILSGNYADWIRCSSARVDAMTSDVIAPSPWKLIGCQNGLRLFKESKHEVHIKLWDDHPAIMAVGVVNGTSEAIFQTLMSLGPSRSEWDFCFYRGSVVERLDGHTDIIHKQLYHDWLPWGMKRRDLLLRRYWRREEDGTYVILYHSVYHKRCPPQNGYIRACLKSGGYVICPLNEGNQSVVRHMLAIDWKSWRSYLLVSSARAITIQMLGRLAALREMFLAKGGNHRCQELESGTSIQTIGLPTSEMQDTKTKVEAPADVEGTVDCNRLKDDVEKERSSTAAGLRDLNDASDEFFDVLEPSDFNDLECEWPSDDDESLTPSFHHPRRSAAGLVKKLQDLTGTIIGTAQKPQDSARVDDLTCCYGATLPKDPTFSTACTWAAGDPSSFLIRGESYLQDQQKVKAKNTLLQMVGADWLKSDQREDDIASRHGSMVQKYAAQGGPEFFFVVNIQVPGVTTYNVALYYMTKTPLSEIPLLEKFVNGDDAYRNSRFKLIPYISKGSWIVKQSVGKKACLVGQALEMRHIRGKNYLELDIDVGSSTVARGVVSLVLGYLNNLVVEMAFLIQGNTEEELPERLLGTCRINHLDVSRAENEQLIDHS